MKRREAIDIIADTISQWKRSTEVVTNEDLAFFILEVIEKKIGMLPPYNTIGNERLEGWIGYCNWDPVDE